MHIVYYCFDTFYIALKNDAYMKIQASNKHLRHFGSDSYCEILLFHGHWILWFDDEEHVHGHLNSWILILYEILLKWIII